MNISRPARLERNARSEKLAWRIAHIIARLHQGDTLDKRQLAEEFGVDVRTIDRDLGERLRGIIERNAEGRWQLSAAARGTVPASYLEGYAQLTGTQGFFPDTSRGWLIRQLETGPAHTGLHVQVTPAEDLRAQGTLFEQLQGAVQQRHPCRFTYKGKPRYVHPLRLIQRNGVWYLAAAEVPGDTPHPKNFSVSRIENLHVDQESRFARNPAHQRYIDEQQDVWFTSQATEAVLRVSPQAAYYFTRRPLLPHQHTRADTDGSLIVTTRIHHPQQLLPVVRYWLPHVRILKPEAWHEALLDSLRESLAAWGAAQTAAGTGSVDEQTGFNQ